MGVTKFQRIENCLGIRCILRLGEWVVKLKPLFVISVKLHEGDGGLCTTGNADGDGGVFAFYEFSFDGATAIRALPWAGMGGGE